MSNLIQPDQLKTILTDGGEFALLDVRERGRYSRGHLLLAINLPLAHFELKVRRYVPRPATRILLCDEGDGLSQRGLDVMSAAGYTDVSIVEDGVVGCAAAGLELYRGHWALPYAFGLYVDRVYRPPHVSPHELKAKMDAGEPLVLLDSRNNDEFRHLSIPGAINVPLAELSYRVRDLAPDPHTQVVVNCGAITRGILGAQSLIEAGVDNEVAVLSNGVRGWDLTDFELAHDAELGVPATSAAAADWAERAAGPVAAQTGVQFISPAQLREWRQDESRTLYIVDVRTREEYEAGHLEGAIWILGGELVGLYEDHIGTMNARICLVDDNGARAITTASWLNRMGWPDVAVLAGGVGDHPVETGPDSPSIPELEAADVPVIDASALAGQIEAGTVLVIDFAHSTAYERGHIPGAWWTLRSTLSVTASRLRAVEHYVTTCPDGRLATLAARDLAALTATPVSVLQGGTDGWVATGREVVRGRPPGATDDCFDDLIVRPTDDRATALATQQRIVAWQEELLEKIERDDTFSFPDLE